MPPGRPASHVFVATIFDCGHKHIRPSQVRGWLASSALRIPHMEHEAIAAGKVVAYLDAMRAAYPSSTNDSTQYDTISPMSRGNTVRPVETVSGHVLQQRPAIPYFHANEATPELRRAAVELGIYYVEAQGATVDDATRQAYERYYVSGQMTLVEAARQAVRDYKQELAVKHGHGPTT